MTASNSNQSSRNTSRVAVTVLGIISLLALTYAILRVDILRARIASLEVDRDAQRATSAQLLARSDELVTANLGTQEQLKRLASLDAELTSLNATMGELRGRTEQSQRSWTRVETLYLLRLAEDQLQLARDVPTALAALQAAEARLNIVRDNTLDGVRSQLQADITALRNVPQVDRAALYTQLDQAQSSSTLLKVMGNVVNNSNPDTVVDNHKAGVERAWLIVKQSVARLFVVRKVNANAEALLTTEDQTLRRHHLQLLLQGLKQSAQLHDGNTYRATLHQTQTWLNSMFDIKDKQVAALDQQLGAWSKLEVAPALPDISGSRKLLERYSPGTP
jgi:uroporphyrin-3 C-methyltransferase